MRKLSAPIVMALLVSACASATAADQQSFDVALTQYDAVYNTYEDCLRSHGLNARVERGPTGVFYQTTFNSPGVDSAKAQEQLEGAWEQAMSDCTTADVQEATIALEKIVTPSDEELRTIAAECTGSVMLPAGPIDEVMVEAAQEPGAAECIEEAVAASINTRFGD